MFDVKQLAALQHVITSPCQFVRQRLGRHGPIGLSELLGIEALGLRTEARRKVRGLDKRPRQVFVAVLGVALAFLLPLLMRLLSTQRA